jgi:antitoxin VapB
MPLSIRSPEVEKLARALARLTGENLTETILGSLRERYDRVRAGRASQRLVEDLGAIARRTAALPKLDSRSADEILGYDEHGLPK